MISAAEDTYLLYFLGALRRRWYIVLACLIVAPGVALATSLHEPKKYSAKAEVLFKETHFEVELFGSSATGPSDATRQAATNLKLVSLESVSQRVAHTLHLSAGDVSEAIAVASPGEADVASVTATGKSPAFAALLANTYVRQFISARREALRQQLLTAQRVVEAQVAGMSLTERESAEGHTLKTRGSQLGVLAALQTGNAELVSPAVAPSESFAPRPKRNAILGLIVGAILGAGLALLIDRLDWRLRTAEDIRLALRLAVLGSVPLGRRLKSDGPQEPRTAGVFRALYANLRYAGLDQELRSVMFTSPSDKDGRSAVAWQLAAAAASSGLRVLVIRADPRDSSESPGLTTVLAGAELSDVVTHQESTLQGGALDVLEPGPSGELTWGLFADSGPVELLESAQDDYDLVVVDAPPLADVPGGIPLARTVSGVVVVARTGAHSKEKLRALRVELDRLGSSAVGTIITGMRTSTERRGSLDFVPSLEAS
jgi:succinoglycan biosynthesis transport protein ExoP